MIRVYGSAHEPGELPSKIQFAFDEGAEGLVVERMPAALGEVMWTPHVQWNEDGTGLLRIVVWQVMPTPCGMTRLSSWWIWGGDGEWWRWEQGQLSLWAIELGTIDDPWDPVGGEALVKSIEAARGAA